MSSPQEPYVDPSGNTEAFQAFVRRGGAPDESVPAKKKPQTTLIAIVSAAVVVVIGIVVAIFH